MPPCSQPSCSSSASVRRARDGRAVCAPCFTQLFEEDVHRTITTRGLARPGERVAVGVSGGKDSTVLARVLSTLNARHGYGIDPFLVAVDEGIQGYRDDSLRAVEKSAQDYGLPLKVVSYSELYGWTMDQIVERIGLKNNCTFCGVFRRQALDRGAHLVGAQRLATGHNADDVAETVLLNVLRGDVARLVRCTGAETGGDGEDLGDFCQLPRMKPLIECYEKDIVMYARVNRLHYFSTECIYAPNSHRSYSRTFVKRLERVRPRALLDLAASASNVAVADDSAARQPAPRLCERCGYLSSQAVCKACLLLEGLRTNDLTLGVRRTKASSGRCGSSTKNGQKNEKSNSSSCGCTTSETAESQQNKSLEF